MYYEKKTVQQFIILVGIFYKHTETILYYNSGGYFLIIGIWFKPCLYIGIALAVFVLVISLIEQLNIKKTFETSDNPDFEEFADTASSENWKKDVIDFVKENTKETNKNE